LDLLKALQTIPITLEVLQKTRIGMTVNNLRKSISDEDVITLSKTLIKSWKKLLSDKDSKPETDAQKAGNNGAETQKNNSTNESSTKSNSNTNSGNSSKSGSAGPPFRQTSFPADTTNSVRLKCRELLANALKYEDSYDSDETLFDPEDIACKIEDQIFKEFKDTNPKYKTRIRSRVANLNDKKNPDLKLNVLRGSIKPEKIAVMTAEVSTHCLLTLLAPFVCLV